VNLIALCFSFGQNWRNLQENRTEMKLASFQLQEEKKQIRMDESREDDALGKKKLKSARFCM